MLCSIIIRRTNGHAYKTRVFGPPTDSQPHTNTHFLNSARIPVSSLSWLSLLSQRRWLFRTTRVFHYLHHCCVSTAVNLKGNLSIRESHVWNLVLAHFPPQSLTFPLTTLSAERIISTPDTSLTVQQAETSLCSLIFITTLQHH